MTEQKDTQLSREPTLEFSTPMTTPTPSSDIRHAAPPEDFESFGESNEGTVSLETFVLTYAQLAQIETMGAFMTRERAAGRDVSTTSGYIARLNDFQNMPLG